MLVLAGLNTVKRYLIAHIHVFMYIYETVLVPKEPPKKVSYNKCIGVIAHCT